MLRPGRGGNGLFALVSVENLSLFLREFREGDGEGRDSRGFRAQDGRA
jgi:hypothetical protein